MPKLEILEFDSTRPGDYDFVRVALDGKVAVPFEIPKSVWREQFVNTEEFEAFLVRQAQTLLDEYGDSRHSEFV